MTNTYWWVAQAGTLSIRQFNKGAWRLWAGDEFISSFAAPEAAVQALTNGSVKLPLGRWKAPADIDDWLFAQGRLPPDS